MLTGGDDNNNNGSHGNGRVSWWQRFRRQKGTGADAFRRLVLQLHYDLSGSGQVRSVLLTTPGRSDDSALSSMTLAYAFAREIRKPVLLIDANPRAPLTTQSLGSKSTAGCAELLIDRSIPLDSLVFPTSAENVFFLPAGSATSRVPEPLEVAEFLALATAAYDFVVLAGDSVLNDSLTRALAPHVGCVLLLAAENDTSVDELDAAHNALALGKVGKVAVVLTTAFGDSV